MESFGDRAHFFFTANELLGFLRLSGRKCLIFRYMSSEQKLSTDIKYTGLIVALGLLQKALNIDIYWIMHNIDRETIDTRPVLTRIRRAALKRAARKIFVTDSFFKEKYFPDDARVGAISFGEKRGGAISRENLQKIRNLSQSYDLVALCLGAKGDKYTHFTRLPRLTQLAAQHGRSLAFILPDHAQYEGENAIHIDEPNIDEKAIAPYVDFVYRINADVSMPYTLYAACSAGIPIVTARESFTYEIIQRYGIGFDEAGFFSATGEQIASVRQKMSLFIERSSWTSLSERIQNLPLGA